MLWEELARIRGVEEEEALKKEVTEETRRLCQEFASRLLLGLDSRPNSVTGTAAAYENIIREQKELRARLQQFMGGGAVDSAEHEKLCSALAQLENRFLNSSRVSAHCCSKSGHVELMNWFSVLVFSSQSMMASMGWTVRE
ncbi:hypothetical protein FJT64_012802 [Amphibalanus amphitrite]|uniref:Uncharacterized protein n=1 Tax=Amphibalanus amphitrite TaxID=1232801 RepID=A0A6A4V4Z4_AMPAM|nr:hypothetical protein FJT64_012802 [Amphibalanus amphitrite]